MVDVSSLLEEGQRHAVEAGAGFAIGAVAGYLSERYDRPEEVNIMEETGASTVGTLAADGINEAASYVGDNFAGQDVQDYISSDDYAAIIASAVAGAEWGRNKAYTREIKSEADTEKEPITERIL